MFSCAQNAPLPHHRAMERSDSVVVMTSTILLFSCLAIASILGRSSSTLLHRTASDSFARRPKHQINRFGSFYGTHRLFADCESGRLTAIVGPISEICGILLAAPLLSLSLSGALPAPFDATAILCMAALLCFVLYICSFSLHLSSVARQFAAHPSVNCPYFGRRRCLPILSEAVSVSAGDMASLLEESNWSSTSLLGRSRGRTFSEASRISEMLERGEATVDVQKEK